MPDKITNEIYSMLRLLLEERVAVSEERRKEVRLKIRSYLKSTKDFQPTTSTSTSDDAMGLPTTNVIPLRRPAAALPENMVIVQGGRPELKVLQERLVQVIDDNYESLHEALDELGCVGDCHRCPNPEKHPNVYEQVWACLKNTVETLDLDRQLMEP